MDTGTDNDGLKAAVVKEAESWLGTPFHHQAMIKGIGVGCGTLLIAVYGSLKIPVPDISAFDNFSIDWHHHATEERYLDILMRYAKVVESPKTGDIALFKMGRVYAHSTIIHHWPIVIHSYWNRAVEYSDALQPPISRSKKNPPIFLSPF